MRIFVHSLWNEEYCDMGMNDFSFDRLSDYSPAGREALTLLCLNGMVRESLCRAFPQSVWLQAEISELHTAAAGHCYMELVEKDATSHVPVAKARGIVWSRTWTGMHRYFEECTGRPLAAGIKVMLEVDVEFSEMYGYSLIVRNIDPSYTVGDLALRRRKILKQLEEEGVLTLNKELPLPLLLQRIAVVSSPSAAGYGDFCRQLEENPYDLRFEVRLFPAVMQGEQVQESILSALDAIAAERDSFDVVVIIRGGGAVSDLSGFDTYLLAAACAQFPLPLVTGIGHERDDTLIDLVAHTRVKTPTAAAQFLITRQKARLEQLEETARRIRMAVQGFLAEQTRRLEQSGRRVLAALPQAMSRERRHLGAWQLRLSARTQHLMGAERARTGRLSLQIRTAARQQLVREAHRLALLGQKAEQYDPARILRQGYSLTLKDGHVVSSVEQIRPGDSIETRLKDGTFRSVVGEEGA